MKKYQDKNLSVKERAEDLLSRMTTEQKIAQLQCLMAFGKAPSVSDVPSGLGEIALTLTGLPMEQHAEALRKAAADLSQNEHGIPPIFHIEALTGLTSNEKCTVFPSAIGLGATFDPEIVGRAAKVIHDQTHAMGYQQTLSPVLDVCRDPRWGRIGETYGEDPTLNAMMGVAYVKNLQGEEGGKIAATGKHFLGYGSSSGGLNMATCASSLSEIREVHAKPFQAAMSEAGLMSVMNSYGTIEGESIIASEHILTDLLRGEMEFDGLVVSDYASIERLTDHRLAADMKQAGAMALQAGLDVECPLPRGYATEYLLAGLKDGTVSQDWIDRSARRVLEAKIRLGLLDGGEQTPDFSCFSDQARQVSLEAARKSIVLLKNDGVLPLEKKKQKIAVIGPHADNVRLLFGCYTFVSGLDMVMSGTLSDQAGMEGADVADLAAATMNATNDVAHYPGSEVEVQSPAALAAVRALYPDTPTVLESLRKKCPDAEFIYLPGCDLAGNDRSGFAEAVRLAAESDVVIAAVGGKYGWGHSCTIGEGIDSDQIGLTGVQEDLVLSLCETGKKVVVLHMDARPFSSPAIAEKASAILEVWFPGTSGGEAVADVLFGDYNPAGRLSATAARSVGQIPIYCGQYTGNSLYSALAPTNACRYVDSTVMPLYPFGYGLSYTSFAYDDLAIDREEIPSDGSITVSCKVRNTGNMDGEEVVQLYVSDLMASKLRPWQEFAGCRRIALKAGEEKTVSFTVRADQFAFTDKDGKWIVEAGDMALSIGGSSMDQPLRGSFRITDTAAVRPARRGFYAKTEVR